MRPSEEASIFPRNTLKLLVLSTIGATVLSTIASLLSEKEKPISREKISASAALAPISSPGRVTATLEAPISPAIVSTSRDSAVFTSEVSIPFMFAQSEGRRKWRRLVERAKDMEIEEFEYELQSLKRLLEKSKLALNDIEGNDEIIERLRHDSALFTARELWKRVLEYHNAGIQLRNIPRVLKKIRHLLAIAKVSEGDIGMKMPVYANEKAAWKGIQDTFEKAIKKIDVFVENAILAGHPPVDLKKTVAIEFEDMLSKMNDLLERYAEEDVSLIGLESLLEMIQRMYRRTGMGPEDIGIPKETMQKIERKIKEMEREPKDTSPEQG